MSETKLIIGTRGSALARQQSAWVRAALQLAHKDRILTEELVIETRGDRIVDRPLPQIGGKGLFTEEIEAALLAGQIDLAVHSLKDLPVEMPAGLALAAVPPREDPRDVFVAGDGRRLHEMRAGDVVGTSSPRRAAQLQTLAPGIVVVDLRGNVPTRLEKVRRGDPPAAVLAAAGLSRLGLLHADFEILEPEVMTPAPGQGALGLQMRAGDRRVAHLLAALDHDATRRAVTAERRLLALMGGGCSAALGACAKVKPDGSIELVAVFYPSANDRRTARVHAATPEAVAAAAAVQLERAQS